jgi:hypothetical protein
MYGSLVDANSTIGIVVAAIGALEFNTIELGELTVAGVRRLLLTYQMSSPDLGQLRSIG